MATAKKKNELEVVTPVGPRILIMKDTNKGQTKGGIILPDDAKIPVITARVLEVSEQVEKDFNYPVKQYDKVLVNPARAIPVDFEAMFEESGQKFVIPVEDVVAIIGKKN